METVQHDIVDQKGKKVGSIDLDPRAFGVKVNAGIVHQAVRWQRAKRRAGTHSALTRSMMKGGGKKPYRQKGTGMARAGSNISPLWVGGASIHGPTPRSYEFKFPKKVRRLALASALTDKLKKERLVVLKELAVSKGKTKEFSEIVKGLGLETKSILLVLPDGEGVAGQDLLIRASRNVKGVLPITASGVNVYDLLKHKYLVGTKESIEALQQRVRA